jgi:magnesium transporter
MKSVMFVIAGERLDCIGEVFQKDMGFKIPEASELDMMTTNLLDRRSLYIMNNNIRASRRSAVQLAPDSSRLKKLEMVLYKILHSMFLRIEEIIEKMDKEVGNCIDYVQNLSVDENNEFIIKINKTQKELSLCKAFVTRKAMLLPQLANTKFLSKTFNEYLKSMSLNMSKLEKKVISSKRMLKNNEKVYNSYVDEAISQSSKKLNRLLQVFSAITAIFLPLNIIAAFMGMNVTVPFQADKTQNYWPFITIIIFSVAYLIFIVIFFKAKNWL